jgi:hypothetical protein
MAGHLEGSLMERRSGGSLMAGHLEGRIQRHAAINDAESGSVKLG